MDCSKYNINVGDLYLSLVPYFWRIVPETEVERTKFINYLEVIAGSLDNTQSSLLALCTALKAFLEVTGQHLSLENFLNDTYDATLRRIFITENDKAIIDAWYKFGESDPQNKVWYTFGESDPLPKVWYLQSEGMSTDYNFTINIPAAVTFNEGTLRSLINSYVIVLKTYNIVIF